MILLPFNNYYDLVVAQILAADFKERLIMFGFSFNADN